jgi:predicted tellurium resistance membrane protein TerC
VSQPEAYISLVTLTVLEIVLGIDNIVFISILAGKLPKDQQQRARRTGLGLALVTRVGLLCSLAFLSHLTAPLFKIFSHAISGRDLVLLVGGLFLVGKATHEIHDKLEGEDGDATQRVVPKFWNVIVQILILDLVFSLDSVITAVGMARHVPIMIAAVVLAVIFMLFFADYISKFIDQHPTLKMLALSFLIMIGFVLIAEAFHKEIPKGYVYFAMAFSIGVEMLNIRVRSKRAKTVHLNQKFR